MVKIKRMPRIKFNNRIYKKIAIKQAIIAFASMAKFDIKEGDGYTMVNMHPIGRPAGRILTDEFANYVLGVTKKCL